ncbi:lytic murein transglycosylase B [SAR86 cluster bacterium]|nr:lytic murein transglycosylase B [SAR86 cluster bacterium]
MKRIFLLSFFYAANTFSYVDKGETFEYLKSELILNHGFSEDYVVSTLNKAIKQDKIIQSISEPAEFTWTWDRYKDLFIEEKRIQNGKKFISENIKTLKKAESRFGVPKEIITSILGVETRYGKIMGSYRVLDALTTLSFDFPRRSKFFTNELINLFLLSRENNLEILSLKGSYAGAMGYGQFIPSSYRAYAIDFDNDGYVDLLNSVDDAIGSIANYLYIHGWNKDLPTIRRIDQKFLSNTQSINNVRNPLILAPNILHASDELENEDILDQSVLLLSYHERGNTDFFVGTANFIAITKYNRSHFYAKAVYDLSIELR